MCEWFAACVRKAAGFVQHPILGKVPCCEECADKAGRILVKED